MEADISWNGAHLPRTENDCKSKDRQEWSVDQCTGSKRRPGICSRLVCFGNERRNTDSRPAEACLRLHNHFLLQTRDLTFCPNVTARCPGHHSHGRAFLPDPAGDRTRNPNPTCPTQRATSHP